MGFQPCSELDNATSARILAPRVNDTYKNLPGLHSTMEHLFFEKNIDDPSETKFAYESDTLWTDWAAVTDVIDFVPPETPWLGFEHDEAPRADTLRDYPASIGWDIDQIW